MELLECPREEAIQVIQYAVLRPRESSIIKV
ncbi:hypothetical protein BN9982_2490001 [Mycobacterium tuberculosis]|nr:hypothetical protein BN9982_2490001 [Mycobacterium tuberculosis]